MGSVASGFLYGDEEVSAPEVTQTPADAPAGAQLLMGGLVRKEEVIARKSSIPVCGRYTNDRELEQHYTLLDRVLGTGASGDVRLAVGKADGRKYAVKSFRKSGMSQAYRLMLKNEAELYLQLDHPHIAQLSMVCETDELLHLVMECMEGGELFARLQRKRRFSEDQAVDAIYQMLLAVAYLHTNKIAHRDLKLENFLYERKHSNHLKLIDFGFAKFSDPDDKMSQACGTVHYIAPEVLFESYTAQADMWSMGVIAHMLLTGMPAFRGTDSDVLRKIRTEKPQFASRFAKLSAQAQDFVRSLLVRNPAERLSAAAALEHPWIKGRELANSATIDASILWCLRTFAEASSFCRASLSMMAWLLTTEEQLSLREQFLLLDRQKRGSITLEQLQTALGEYFDVDSDEVERLFSSIDCNNSQEIEYSEFCAAALMGQSREDVMRRAFSRFDRDEKGFIAVEELRSVVGENFAGVDVEELIKEVDTSGDGHIGYDEFAAYFQGISPSSIEGAAENTIFGCLLSPRSCKGPRQRGGPRVAGALSGREQHRGGGRARAGEGEAEGEVCLPMLLGVPVMCVEEADASPSKLLEDGEASPSSPSSPSKRAGKAKASVRELSLQWWTTPLGLPMLLGVPVAMRSGVSLIFIE